MRILTSMIVITIRADSSRHTFYLEKPTEALRSVSLISCTLVNSCRNLAQIAQFYYSHAEDPHKLLTGLINPGNYTLETLKSAIIENFESRGLKKEDFPLKFLPSHSTGGMILVRSQPNISVTFDSALADVLGLDTPEIRLGAGVIKQKSPEAHYKFGDLVKAETKPA